MIVPHGRGLTTQSLNERKVWNHNHLTYNYYYPTPDQKVHNVWEFFVCGHQQQAGFI
jgi:hypothetical protein